MIPSTAQFIYCLPFAFVYLSPLPDLANLALNGHTNPTNNTAHDLPPSPTLSDADVSDDPDAPPRHAAPPVPTIVGDQPLNGILKKHAQYAFH